ncbi:hypothetical protein CK203_070498 [Vitis vinifera]|uniref:CRAL-TRIO domain-containing protein n=1 Tax=Vitis vinifera TaxID=29760 RepID=A0A438FAT0_VITVI|nr:hypothetical protein CK203_070498 [Vitis vinifera]
MVNLILSRPLLVLSIATAFSDQSECTDETSDGSSGSHGNNDSHECSEPEPHAEPSSLHSAPDTRHKCHDFTGHECFHALCRIFDVDPQSIASEKWLQQLYKELERQGISLPERINEDELHRFYTAVNGDFSCLLLSIKKTIYWRKTYHILSAEELEMWSNMVFWHGFDMKHRPCLIVRLGLACFILPSHDRPRFAQAVAYLNDERLQTAVSQIEHGVLHLVDTENPQITILLDCEGLSPLRFPMQIMRSCSSLLQDHFPNRLGCLFVIRLPPVVRVVAQTFIQVLKPITRQKLRFEGEMYLKVLSEHLQTLPSYLGGKCACIKCSKLNNMHQPSTDEETSNVEPITDSSDDEDLSYLTYQIDDQMNDTCDQVLRTAVMGVLMFWVLMAVMAGLPDLVPMR